MLYLILIRDFGGRIMMMKMEKMRKFLIWIDENKNGLQLKKETPEHIRKEFEKEMKKQAQYLKRGWFID